MNVERGETKVAVGGCVSPHPRQRGRWFDWSHNTRVKTQPVCCPLLLSALWQRAVLLRAGIPGLPARIIHNTSKQLHCSSDVKHNTEHWNEPNVLHSLQVSNQVQVIKLESIWVQMLAAAKHTQKHIFSSSSWLFSDTIWKCHTNRGPDTFGLLTKNTQSCIILESPSFYNALGHSTKEIDEERFIFRTWCLFPESRFYRSSTRCASARHIDLDLGKHMYRYTQSPHRLHWWGNLHSCEFKSPSVLSLWLPQSMFFLAPPLQGVALWSHPFSQSLASFFSCPRSSLLERSLVPTLPLLHLPCAGWFHVFAFPFLSISSLSSFFFASLSFLFCNLLSLFSFILVLRPALSLFTSSLLGLTFSIVAWFSSLPHTYWLLPVRQSLSHFSASLSYAYRLELPQETESNPALMSTKAIATIFSFFPPSLITSSQSCSIPAYLVH